MFLIYQNGEACISCPLTCTDGMVALLEQYAESAVLKKILKHCTEGIQGDFGIGAQFITDIQGGSDVPSNLVEAVPEDDEWRLYGKKFFCSAAHGRNNTDTHCLQFINYHKKVLGIFILVAVIIEKDSDKRSFFCA